MTCSPCTRQFQVPVSPAATGLILRRWRDEADRNDDVSLKFGEREGDWASHLSVSVLYNLGH